jgi:hypothetical protein
MNSHGTLEEQHPFEDQAIIDEFRDFCIEFSLDPNHPHAWDLFQEWADNQF